MTIDKNQEIEDILNKQNYYDVLQVTKNASPQEIRRAYILKSRYCHPDKSPTHPKATQAFQKLSSAYETLSNPTSKLNYDFNGEKTFCFDSQLSFIQALTQIYKDFVDGNFENLLSILDFIQQRNPELNIDRESANKLLMELRDIVLVSNKYMEVVKEEIFRLYIIQNELCSLSYFNIFGRLKLTLKLSKSILAIPLVMNSIAKERSVINEPLLSALKLVIIWIEKMENSFMFNHYLTSYPI